MWSYPVTLMTCPNCSEVYVSIPKMKQLHQLIGMNLCCQEEKLTGQEIRFLRKGVRLKAIDFASVLSVDPSTLSRYENNHESPSESTDKLIRLAYINLINLRDGVVQKVDWVKFLQKVAGRPANPKRILKINQDEWLDKVLPDPGSSALSCISSDLT